MASSSPAGKEEKRLMQSVVQGGGGGGGGRTGLGDKTTISKALKAAAVAREQVCFA